ncbi:MAG TPA: leucine--tRNA ligase, partial [Firmicutes bacterium]|nr:leucine--tRNA ligase [Bacillota bacterium]
PLENATEWKKYDRHGIHGTRETSTMPGSAGSSWYYMRYIDPRNDKQLCDPELLKHWMPVDLYVGGPEHAVGHLIYSRIWNRFLYDEGISPVKEPFQKLVHQGMILGENGIKMGKRYPEFVVNPSDVVRDYGADTLRLYEMFMGPLEVSKPWSTTGVVGAKKFINRVWNFFTEPANITEDNDGKLTKIYHQTVKKVTSDFESLGFNTAIAQMMVFINDCYKAKSLYRPYIENFVKMFSCICPFVGEEMWQKLGHDHSIAYESWPTFDESKLIKKDVTIGVSINGKVRDSITLNKTATQEEAVKSALSSEKVRKWTDGKAIRKVIYVPGRILNILVG